MVVGLQVSYSLKEHNSLPSLTNIRERSKCNHFPPTTNSFCMIVVAYQSVCCLGELISDLMFFSYLGLARRFSLSTLFVTFPVWTVLQSFQENLPGTVGHCLQEANHLVSTLVAYSLNIGVVRLSVYASLSVRLLQTSTTTAFLFAHTLCGKYPFTLASTFLRVVWL